MNLRNTKFKVRFSFRKMIQKLERNLLKNVFTKFGNLKILTINLRKSSITQKFAKNLLKLGTHIRV